MNWVLPELTSADDILLIPATAVHFQKLLYICDKEANARGLHFNNKILAVMLLVGPEERNLGN